MAVDAPGALSARLLGSPDGTRWSELAALPRLTDSIYARADVCWQLPSGEALGLSHVPKLAPTGA